jgi:hypothetical protein
MAEFFQNRRKAEDERRQEALNAYLDNALTPAERRRFERAIAGDPALRADLERLRFVKAQISRLPQVKAPRSFVLDPAKYGRPVRPVAHRLYPALRLATVFTAFLFVLVLVTNLFVQGAPAADRAAEEQVSMSEPAAPEAAVEEVLEQPFGAAEVAPEPTVEVAAEEAEEAEAAAGEAAPTSDAELYAFDTPTPAATGTGAVSAMAPVAEATMVEPDVTTNVEDGADAQTEAAGETAEAQELAERATAAPAPTVAPPVEPAGADTFEQEGPAEATPPTVTGDDDGPSLSPLNLLQIGFGFLLVVLLAATLALRRRL